MRGNVTRLLSVLGALIVIQSVAWEYARMRPEYQFIVEPWSKRGYEIVHGSVAATLGVLLLGFILLILWSGSMHPGKSPLIAGAMWIAAVAVAVIYADEDVTVDPSLFLSMVFGAFAAYVVVRAVTGSFGERLPAWLRTGGGSFLMWLGGTIVIGLLTQVVAGDDPISMPAWVAIAVVVGLLALMAVGSSPRELAANRMLIMSTIGAWIAVALSAGAIRATLLRLQTENMAGLSGDYRDAQITSGWFLAQLGFLLMFVGSVAMWARRRDIIINRQRAARQRAAAEKSAAEIQAALEAAIAAEPPKA